VLRWPLEEVALVAAYCAMEAEDFKQGKPTASPGPTAGAGKVKTETVTWVAGKKRG
jgi:hypothetical protein